MASPVLLPHRTGCWCCRSLQALHRPQNPTVNHHINSPILRTLIIDYHHPSPRRPPQHPPLICSYSILDTTARGLPPASLKVFGSSTPVRRHTHHFSRPPCQQSLNATITSSALSWQRLSRRRALYRHHVQSEEESCLQSGTSLSQELL